MDISLLLRGLMIGLSIAAPVGPIGILCIRRTLAEGRASGLVSGLGAATADALYGSIAGFGLTFLANCLIRQQDWLRLIGGLFLCYLGLKTWWTQPSPPQTVFRPDHGQQGHADSGPRSALASPPSLARDGRSKVLVRAYVSTFFLTLTNPLTILSFAAVFAGLGLSANRRDYGAAVALILGVFIGSALWWLMLSSGVGLLREKFGPQGLQWINRISGIIITGFGLFALWSIL